MSSLPDISGLLGTESQPIFFPTGLIGFEEWKNFVIIAHAAGGALRLLQSLDDDRVSLIVMDPRHIEPLYKITLTEEDKELLQMAPEKNEVTFQEAGVYCILCVQEEPFAVTANLFSPLVINWESGQGMQVILSNSGYDIRHPVARAVVEPEESGE